MAYLGRQASKAALNANDIPDNSITASKIAAGAITAADVAADMATQAELDTVSTAVTTETTNRTTADTALAFQSVPHIIPGVLYPAVGGKLLDGSTSHSGAYGTAQSDSRKYYYTDIKGSKPIKDPRIGAHFGSQRHKFKSIQLLEQETATSGLKIYSIDGRENMRVVGTDAEKSGNVTFYNDSAGNYFLFNSTAVYIEITGYFNSINLSEQTEIGRGWRYSLDGAAEVGTSYGTVSANSPLGGRYVDGGSFFNIPITPSLGIHTIKLRTINNNNVVYGVELIAQDTTSTATKSQIQIPSQNVVSYGKKFTVSGTPHYNPFATKGDGSASTIPNNTTGDSVATGWAGSTSAYWDSTLDTATSLGLGAWESGGNYYRPVNGGRVVKWVDSSGTIKTSVNMMPPEASTIMTSAQSIWSIKGEGTCDATGTHNWSTQYQPQFGNKRIGSNLITSWINGDQTGGVPFDTTFTTSGANITEADSDGTTSYCKTNAFSLTKGKTYRLTMVHADVGSGGESPNIAVTGDINRSYYEWSYLQPIENATNTAIFVADQTTTDGRVYVQNNATAEWSGVFTLYEIEQPEAQAEVTKTFHGKEFGNGSANGNTSYRDATVLNTATQYAIGYVMDDGLTSLTGDYLESGQAGTVNTVKPGTYNKYWYVTFIGTGISLPDADGFTAADGNPSSKNIAQNLPYGTHILKGLRESGSSAANGTIILDGVTLLSNLWAPGFENLSIHQPKRPPIPEDAVVLADYMLMADFVGHSTTGIDKISKGVRLLSCSRDVLFDGAGSFTFDETALGGFTSYSQTSRELPAFCTNFGLTGYSSRCELTKDGVNNTGLVTNSATNAVDGKAYFTDSFDLDTYVMGHVNSSGQNGNFNSYQIATPIHTSSHYQTFETPYLHELVGGDRNMEQTNLVVTPDGKTWDEVTRDVSYLGNMCLHTSSANTSTDGNTIVNIMTKWRGHDISARKPHYRFNKDFAIAYDRMFCLKAGQYQIKSQTRTTDSDGQTGGISINGTVVLYGLSAASAETCTNIVTVNLVRGDYIQIIGNWNSDGLYSSFEIIRVN